MKILLEKNIGEHFIQGGREVACLHPEIEIWIKIDIEF